MDFICTRPCNPGPKGTGIFAPEAIPRKWVSAVDHARKRHPIIVTIVTGNTSVTVPLRTLHRRLGPGTPPVQDRGASYYTYPQHFKYRTCRRKFYPQFPVSPPMSPTPLQTQHAAVLYGSKDLRYEERTLWPPRPNEAQVRVVATGLCGSDRTSPSRPTPVLMLTHFFQSITISMAGTATSSSKPPWSSATNPLAS